MNAYLSDKIRVVSLISIIFVLYIHSGFHDYPNEIQGMTFNFTLQQAISRMLGRCAVPMFFSISGYLYFRDLESYGQLWQKIQKRGRTLVVPYMIACLFPAIFALAMEALPWTKSFINGTGFSENLTKPWYSRTMFQDVVAKGLCADDGRTMMSKGYEWIRCISV